MALQPDDTSGSYSMRGIDTTTAVYATLYDVSSRLTAVKKTKSAHVLSVHVYCLRIKLFLKMHRKSKGTLVILFTIHKSVLVIKCSN